MPASRSRDRLRKRRRLDSQGRDACRLGLEGIVSKHRDHPYRSGRSKTWIKVKNPAAPGVLRSKEDEPLPIAWPSRWCVQEALPSLSIEMSLMSLRQNGDLLLDSRSTLH
jgi:hypothetical protein